MAGRAIIPSDLLTIRVIPRASRSGVDGMRDGAIVVRLNAPPVDGAANQALIDVLATSLHVPKRSINIVSGERGRLKRVRVDGITIDTAMRRLGLLLLLLVIGASRLVAQSPAGPAFELTSVKPSNPDVPGPRSMPVGGRYSASNVTLRELVLRAYDLFDSQLEGGPDWQRTRRFDIQAKAADPVAGLTAMQPMLKTLLADRFKLKVHTERREMPIYALVVTRGDGQLSPNMTRSTADCARAERELAEAGTGAVGQLLQAGMGVPCALMPVSPPRVAGAATMRARDLSMVRLAEFLTVQAGRMVQDRTGLSGLYDWEITYNPRVGAVLQSGSITAPPPPPPNIRPLVPPPPGGDTPLPTPFASPPLMIALQEQLGLKLESTRGLVEILVIDSAALPGPD
jgi:uncharacterized protein (TIGR00251 family)